MPNKLALFINHNIFLSNEQYKELEKNKKIKTLGVSVSVWVNAKTTKTTEPAIEFFCDYEISGEEDCKEENIKITKNGFKIILPEKIEIKNPKDISFEELSKMSKEEREYHERKRKRWWLKNVEPVNLSLLLRTKNLKFKIKKLDKNFSKLNAIADVQHSIEISTKEELIKSLT